MIDRDGSGLSDFTDERRKTFLPVKRQKLRDKARNMSSSPFSTKDGKKSKKITFGEVKNARLTVNSVLGLKPLEEHPQKPVHSEISEGNRVGLVEGSSHEPPVLDQQQAEILPNTSSGMN